MPDQLQLRGGTTVQHSTFTGASKEVTVDTTKKTAVVHDGSTVGGNPLMREDASNSALALGSAAAPSLKFTGDLDSGVFSPGANQVAVATNGVGRLFVDASGNVGVGSSSVATYTGQTYLSVDHTTGGVGIAGINLATNGTRNAFLITYPGNSEALRIASDSATLPITVYTNNSERLRVTSAGLVGIGNSSPATTLDVVGGYFTGGNSRTDTDTKTFGLLLPHVSSATNPVNIIGALSTTGQNLVYIGGSDSNLTGTSATTIHFYTAANATTANGTERMRITAAGLVKIGTTTVNNGVLHVKSNGIGSQAGLAVEASANDSFLSITNNGSAHKLEASYNSTGSYQPISFVINGEKARIDTSGRLLVGTSSSPTVGDPQYGLVRIQGNTSSASGFGLLSIGRGQAAASISSGSELGHIYFTANDGSPYASISVYSDAAGGSNDYPGRLVFSTTADGASSPTERMRIGNSGGVRITQDSASVDGLNLALNSASYTGDGVTLWTATAAGTGFYFLRCWSSSFAALNFQVIGNGNVQNTNNSYGAISDAKLKENIVDATSQWADIKALQVRKYNLRKVRPTPKSACRPRS
jgi:hypothetical protein